MGDGSCACTDPFREKGAEKAGPEGLQGRWVILRGCEGAVVQGVRGTDDPRRLTGTIVVGIFKLCGIEKPHSRVQHNWRKTKDCLKR